jgi:hypothetical protein
LRVQTCSRAGPCSRLTTSGADRNTRPVMNGMCALPRLARAARWVLSSDASFFALRSASSRGLLKTRRRPSQVQTQLPASPLIAPGWDLISTR